MATYESGNAEGPPGRHPARGARAGAAARLRDHGSAAGAEQRPRRPADRHGVSGLAPAGACGPGSGELVSSRRAPPPRLSADSGRPACPGHRAQHLAELLRRRHRPPAARAGEDLAMSRPGPPAHTAGPAVEGYLAEVTARLPGAARAQEGIVGELRSGLLDAADAHRSAGLPPAQATRAAIREFGSPARVAEGFRAEIAAGQARRVAVALLVTGPLVGLLWIATAMTSHLGI